MTQEETEFLKQLFQKIYANLLRYASIDLDDPSQAEDAVQEAFHLACRKIDVLMESDHPELWMTRTLRNVIRNRRREAAKHRERCVSLEALETELPDGRTPEDASPLPETVPGVSREQLSLFYAVTLEGESYAETAKRLSLSEAACRKRVQRTRERLRRYYNLQAEKKHRKEGASWN